MSKILPVTPAQAMEIKKMADEKGVDRETFQSLQKEFARLLDGVRPNAKDNIVRVDRTLRLTHLIWVRNVLHPEFEGTGPTKFNITTDVEQWLHNGQQGGIVQGKRIYYRLAVRNELAQHLGFADLLAIQAKGILFFRKHFAGKTVFAWKSVVESYDDGLLVPCLVENDERGMLHWYSLNDYWDSSRPGLRFRQ